MGAAGHLEATRLYSGRACRRERTDDSREAEPVLGADVEHVMAHQEPENTNTVDDETDDVDELEYDDYPDEAPLERIQSPVYAPDIAMDL